MHRIWHRVGITFGMRAYWDFYQVFLELYSWNADNERPHNRTIPVAGSIWARYESPVARLL